MKVLLLNGSPHKNGCTYTALNEVAQTLNNEDIETEIFYIGTNPIAPCKDCRACTKIGKCVIHMYSGYIIFDYQVNKNISL